MNEREWQELRRVHGLIRNFQGRATKAVDDEHDISLHDLFQEIAEAERTVAGLIEDYEESRRV